LWPERIRIGLAPERVDLARLGFAASNTPAKQISVDCPRDPGKPSWAAALDGLDGALTGFAARGDSVAVVLSNHWLRYLVIPWQPQVSDASELDALVRLSFERIFGETAGAWTLHCSTWGYGEASVACAIDTALVSALRERLSAHKLRLVSMQPLLMAAYNEWRRDLAASSALALIEPGRLCLNLMQDGHWSEIISRRTTTRPADAIEQELATLAPDTAPPSIDVLLVGEGTVWDADAVRPARLLGQCASGGCSLALCGAA
jgi:hypothetical protein